MPSFDIVSEVDKHELQNAVDQANREVTTRYDFKGSHAEFALNEDTIQLKAPSKFQVEQMQEILKLKLSKRELDINCLEFADIEESLNESRQSLTVKQGIDKATAKKITKLIKEQKFKVQSAIQEEQIRVTGKKRDDLQQVISALREASLELPLQFINFRD